MAIKRRTEKTVEIHEFYIIRSASGSLPALCGSCATGDAILVAPEPAAAVANVPVRMIYRLVETGMIHYQEAGDGSLTVCIKSLLTTANQVGETSRSGGYQSAPAQINDLIALVRSFNLPHGIENSLLVKLQDALAALDTSDTATACDSLRSFINECSAQSGKKLTVEQTSQLIDAATQISTALGCQ